LWNPELKNSAGVVITNTYIYSENRKCIMEEKFKKFLNTDIFKNRNALLKENE